MERPAQRGSRQRGRSRAPGGDPLGLADVPPRVAPAAAGAGADRGRGGRHVVGAAVATNTPPAANAGFGTATDLATFQAPDPHLASQIAALQHRFGRVDVIENQTVAIPGSINTYDLRAQNPHGPYGQPHAVPGLRALPGRPGPGGGDQRRGLRVRPQDRQHAAVSGGKARRVVGIVQNPQSLLDEFALVVPGQVTAPTQVTVLFDAPGVTPALASARTCRPRRRRRRRSSNPLNPETIVLALATVGMLLIALVAVGGFTVLAQRRLRSLGHARRARRHRPEHPAGGPGQRRPGRRVPVRWPGWCWAWPPGWPTGRVVEADAHHLIGAFQLPWMVIGPAMVLAVLATYFAASRPARAITRIPVVTALAGRPAPPKQVHRSALPGLIVLACAAVLFAYSGTSNGNGNGGVLELVARLRRPDRGGHPAGPVVPDRAGPARPAGPDRGPAGPARPGPLPGPLGLGARRHQPRRADRRDRLRRCPRSGSATSSTTPGPTWRPTSSSSTRPTRRVVAPAAGPAAPTAGSKPQSWAGVAHGIAAALGSHDIVQLDQTSASLQHAASGRAVDRAGLRGHAAAAARLRDHGLPGRPGRRHPHHAARAVGHLASMQLVYGNYFNGPDGPPGGGTSSFPCPKASCLANPVIQEVSALPSGTSAPNTVITEHAIRTLAPARRPRRAGSSRPRTRPPPRRSPTPGSPRPRRA